MATGLRWTFDSYDLTKHYELPRNPSKSSKVFGDFAYSATPTTVSNGRIVEWEGAIKPTPWRFTGRVFTQAEYQDMVTWCNSGRIYITDHLGLRYLVRVADLSMTRVKDKDRAWHHAYEVQADVLAGVGVL